MRPEYKQELLGTIEDAARNKPRSLQKRIGPSGIGNPCNRCLGYSLAQVPSKRDHEWLPFIGTAVHAAIEEVFKDRNKQLGRQRYLVEARIETGFIDGEQIDGSADLYDTDFGYNIDWKIVGDNTLRYARKGILKPSYEVQAHTYGWGQENAGRAPTEVAVAFLPRNARSIFEAVILSADYDRSIAERAFKRANDIMELGKTRGWHEVLTRLKRDPACYDCKYERQITPDEALAQGFIAA